jgi:hypothetical protein
VDLDDRRLVDAEELVGIEIALLDPPVQPSGGRSRVSVKLTSGPPGSTSGTRDFNTGGSVRLIFTLSVSILIAH